jgi:hypothetical protein
MVLINHKKCLRDYNSALVINLIMLENLILPVAAFAATILGLESAWRWLGNQE